MIWSHRQSTLQSLDTVLGSPAVWRDIFRGILHPTKWSLNHTLGAEL